MALKTNPDPLAWIMPFMGGAEQAGPAPPPPLLRSLITPFEEPGPGGAAHLENVGQIVKSRIQQEQREAARAIRTLHLTSSPSLNAITRVRTRIAEAMRTDTPTTRATAWLHESPSLRHTHHNPAAYLEAPAPQ
jgi:hypothetical protein